MNELLARCRFPAPGTDVVCAVSGGADSLALLVLARAADLAVTAVHVDHGLRPESAAEADVVREAAAHFGAAFRGEHVDVTRGPNLEARARAARRAVLGSGVLTGHTADDQVETIVLNLLRGAGLDGLRGMRPDRTKPLLGLRRRETRALCDAVGLVPVVDPTNDDRAFRRNRVRHELLPLLDDIAEREVVEVIARQAELLGDDADLLDELAAAIDPSDATALVSAPPPIARRAVRRWLRAHSDGEHHPPDRATVERVLAVARGDRAAADVGGGREVRRSRGRLRIQLPSNR